ncbi:hypothetical protein FQV39_31390 (plasmid) [Bosea sp. F3-2]|uniref:hypothetical protein n=1 Tax=Bosea sp. F3-2 TaxID=2599640 RepID=UPI0011F037FF|nr:hypothetical protein [Bosea sp. F3-2]QEL27115.1 hypothetical protein FQV39_31390 [Bosea sp. F3-2]
MLDHILSRNSQPIDNGTGEQRWNRRPKNRAFSRQAVAQRSWTRPIRWSFCSIISPGCSRQSKIPVADLRRNVEMIARLCTLLNIPVITTASEPAGTNGPLMPEIHHHAPHAVYVARKGEVNAWDNGDFGRSHGPQGSSWPASGPASA